MRAQAGQAPSSQPNSSYETELAQVDATQIWSSLRRARTRSAAGAGTAGVLQMGYSPHTPLGKKGSRFARKILYNI